MNEEERHYQIDRALDSLQKELGLLLGLSQDLTLKVRASQETAERLKRISEEFRRIEIRKD